MRRYTTAGPAATPYVIFLHVPKTGGSTLRHTFRACYPAEQIYVPAIRRPSEAVYLRYVKEEIDECRPAVDGNAEQLKPLHDMDPVERQALRVFMGHFWYGVHESLPSPSTYVTVLREPVERALSFYAHRVARQGLTLPLEHYIAAGRDWELTNAQTRRLAAPGRGHLGGQVTETMLDTAKERLVERFASVGVTERYDESMVALARALGWRAMGYEWTNRSGPRATRADVRPDVLEQLEERNQFDRELHRFAGERLDIQLRGVDVRGEYRRLARGRRISDTVSRTRRGMALATRVGSRVTRSAISRVRGA